MLALALHVADVPLELKMKMSRAGGQPARCRAYPHGHRRHAHPLMKWPSVRRGLSALSPATRSIMRDGDNGNMPCERRSRA